MGRHRKKSTYENYKYTRYDTPVMPYRRQTQECSDVHGFAQWRDSYKQRYLYIDADDYYSLGFLTGMHLWQEIKHYRSLTTRIFNYSEYLKHYLPFFPADYLKEMEGIMDGVNVNLDHDPITMQEIVAQNVYVDVFFGKPHYIAPMTNVVMAMVEPMGCTAVGGYDDDTHPIIGQNFDFPGSVGIHGSHPSLAFVHHKLNIPGIPEIFGLRMGATIDFPTAVTSNGITSIMNVISSKDEGFYAMPIAPRARYALEHAESAQEFMKWMNVSGHFTCAYNLMASDGNEIIASQYRPTELRVRTDDILVNTNRYVYPDWNRDYFARGNYSLTRQKNAERIMRTYHNEKHHITDEDVLATLGERNHSGGVDSQICRKGKTINDPATLAFITTHHFGLGNVWDGIGVVPI